MPFGEEERQLPERPRRTIVRAAVNIYILQRLTLQQLHNAEAAGSCSKVVTRSPQTLAYEAAKLLTFSCGHGQSPESGMCG